MKTLRFLALTATLGASLLPPRCAGQARFETIYKFGEYPDAEMPQGLVAGADGALYGASTDGGVYGYGAVFVLQPPAVPGGAWTETVLYSFAPQNGDGVDPRTSPAIGPNGALYGTTAPDSPTYGTVYQLQPPESEGGSWTESVLFRSTYFSNIQYLNSVIAGPHGEIYGVSGEAVFELIPPATPGGAWAETVLCNVSGPEGLAIGANGVLYGTANLGGSFAAGAVFELMPPAGAGGAWTLTVLYSFTSGAGGYLPTEPPVIGKGGIIYGTTSAGGGANLGTVFELHPPASPGGSWTETVLYNFGSSVGAPSSPLIVRNGKIYGTTAGTPGTDNQGGSVFELQPPVFPGGPWTQIVLHEFTGRQEPFGSLVMDSSGALYGTTNNEQYGEAPPGGDGSAYRIQP
jgi:hypothetical protein